MEADLARSVLNAITLLARASLAAPLGSETLHAFSPEAQHLKESSSVRPTGRLFQATTLKQTVQDFVLRGSL